MEYVIADNNLSVAPSLSNADVIALVRQDDDDAQAEDDTGEPLPSVTSHQAFAVFKEIQAYFVIAVMETDYIVS